MAKLIFEGYSNVKKLVIGTMGDLETLNPKPLNPKPSNPTAQHQSYIHKP